MKDPWGNILKRLGNTVYLIVVGAVGAAALGYWGPVRSFLERLPLVPSLLAVLAVVLAVVSGKFMVATRTLDNANRKLTDLRRQSALDTELIGLDGELLLLMPGLLTRPDRADAAKDITRAVLRRITEIWPSKVQRAYVLLPDKSGDFLTPWCGFQMADETMRRAKFQLHGTGHIAMGVAGQAFIHKQTRVVHMRTDGSMDTEEYIEFDTARKMKPYKSFVCVPMLAQTDDCVGIMCLDSNTDGTVFDPQEITGLLVALGARLATLISMYQSLEATLCKPSE